MKIFYCDRCKRETDELFERKITDRIEREMTFSKTVELCADCNEYIEQSEKRYNELLVNQRIAFYKTLMLYPTEKGGEKE